MLKIIRHMQSPRVDGCRWCGFQKATHVPAACAGCCTTARGPHSYTPPTPEQREARAKAITNQMSFTNGELSDLTRGIQRDENDNPVYREPIQLGLYTGR